MDERLRAADPAGVAAHKLGPLAAWNLRQRDVSPPPILERAEQLSRSAWLLSIPLLSRIRSLVEGPLLVFKGPELAALYPGRARGFVDIDLLCPDAEAVQAALIAHGFVEVDDEDLFEDHHHQLPLQWPTLWLKLEIHSAPWWSGDRPPPSMEDIVAAAVPSATGISGVLAPHAAHHAVMIASHAWFHEPLSTLRDLVDVAVLAAQTDAATLAMVAREWDLERRWRTSHRAALDLLGEGPRSAAVRLWGRHLLTMRERSVLDHHLQRWLSGFWELPLIPALGEARKALRMEVFPDEGQGWGHKLVRAKHALTHPGAPLSSHKRATPLKDHAEGENRAEATLDRSLDS